MIQEQKDKYEKMQSSIRQRVQELETVIKEKDISIEGSKKMTFYLC